MRDEGLCRVAILPEFDAALRGFDGSLPELSVGLAKFGAGLPTPPSDRPQVSPTCRRPSVVRVWLGQETGHNGHWLGQQTGHNAAWESGTNAQSETGRNVAEAGGVHAH